MVLRFECFCCLIHLIGIARSQLIPLNSYNTIINSFNDSADIEWKPYNNYTTYTVTAINLFAGIKRKEYTFHTNKGTLDALPFGNNVLKIQGGDCENSQSGDLVGKVGHVSIKASSPGRIEIQNFKVLFTLDEQMQMKFNASWDIIENAKDYLLTVSRIEDCFSNELLWVTNKTSFIGTFKGLNADEASNSTFLFDVRVHSNINDSDIIKPKARQSRKNIPNMMLEGVKVFKTGGHFIKLSVPVKSEKYSIFIQSPTGTGFSFIRTSGFVELIGLQVATKYRFTVYSTEYRDFFLSKNLELFTSPAIPPTRPTVPPMKREWEITAINMYKNGADIEFPYFNNYTSYQIDAVSLQPIPFSKTFFFNNTNKGSLDVPPTIFVLKITGIARECSDFIIAKNRNDAKTSSIILNALFTSRIDLQNFKVQFAWDENMQVVFKASWDGIQKAKNYGLTVRRIEDCLPNELSWDTTQTSMIEQLGILNEKNGSNFVFDVRVKSKVDSSRHKPVAPQLRKFVTIELADVEILKSDNQSTITLLLGNNTEEYHILIGQETLKAKPGKFVIDNASFDDQNSVYITVLSASFRDRLLMKKIEIKVNYDTTTEADTEACSNTACAQQKANPVCGSNKLTYENECEFQYASCQSEGNITKAHNGGCAVKESLPPLNVECKDHRQIDLVWKGPDSLTYTLKYKKLNETHKQQIENLTLEGVTRYSLTCLEANTTYAISLEDGTNTKETKIYSNPPTITVSTGLETDEKLCSTVLEEDECMVSAGSKASQIQLLSFIVNLLLLGIVLYATY